MSIATDQQPSHSSVLYASLAARPPKIIGAEGHYFHTADGYSIFDASGGAAVSCIGHGHPKVKQAIKDQLDTVEYCFSPHFTTEAYEKLAQYLTDSTNGAMDKVFICGSGAEAIEAAIKMARQYYMELPQPQPQRTKFIARDRSYHGNTLGSLSLSGHKVRRAPYEPILSSSFSHVSPCYSYRYQQSGESDEEYGDRLAAELEDEFQRLGPETVCGFVAETLGGLVREDALSLPENSDSD